MMQRLGKFVVMAAVGLMVTLTVVDVAEARRSSGGFGSRGSRTFQTAPVTRTAPDKAVPVDRTMTRDTQANQPGSGVNRNAQGQQQRPGGMFGGMAGGLLGGLMMGGLIGMLMGQGLGGGIGFLGLLLQGALIFGAITLAMRFFGRGRQPALSGTANSSARSSAAAAGGGSGFPSFPIPRMGGSSDSAPAYGGGASRPSAASGSTDEIGVTSQDLDRFETMLKEVQAAYGAEDYAGLRRLSTPEAMSYMAEELSENATNGLKNEVRDIHLVSGDVSEAWSEDGSDYATVAMRYESIDALRERASGRVVSGDADNPTETVELWTFVRKQRGDWLVSAIQSAA